MTTGSGESKTLRRESRAVGSEGGNALAASAASRKGTVTYEGDTATIAFERRIRHPIERVWDAITNPDQLAGWYMTTARLEARQGGTLDYVSGISRFHVTGRILTWQPPRVYEHEWNVEPRQGLPKGERSVIRWELTPDGDETILRISHRRLTRPTSYGFVSGLHVFLDRLEQQLDGTPLTDFEAGVQATRPLYPPPGR